jgi:opacity protein-like surface antigen
MSPMARMSVSTLLLTLLISIAGAAPARAEGFISPFIGYNFGGDSGCPSISNCEDKNLNWGIGVGAVGGLFGVEAEFAFIPNFFGEVPGTENSVFTFMGNFLLAPKFGPVQPYGTIGLGLIKSHTDLTLSGLIEDQDESDFGWNTGGGIMIHFSDHLGVRGDVRYFHAFSALEFLGLNLGETKLDYGRLSGALLVKF